jgi:hypothetical protein
MDVKQERRGGVAEGCAMVAVVAVVAMVRW